MIFNNIVCSGVYRVKLNLDILEPQLSIVIKRQLVIVWNYRRLPMTCIIYGSGKLIILGSPNTYLTYIDECQRFEAKFYEGTHILFKLSKEGCGQLLNVKLEAVTAKYAFGLLNLVMLIRTYWDCVSLKYFRGS